MSESGDIRETFFQECEELLEALSDGLSEISEAVDDNQMPDMETVNAVFRAVHSIKGGAGAFGLEDLVRFAHRFETTLDALRSKKIEAEAPLVELFQRAADHLFDLVSAAREGGEADMAAGEELVERLEAAIEGHEEEEVDLDAVFVPLSFDFGTLSDGPIKEHYIIEFAPKTALYRNGSDPAILISALSDLGEMTVVADTDRVPAWDDFDALEACVGWKIELFTTEPKSAIDEVFEFVDGLCDLTITRQEGPEPEPTGGMPLPDLSAFLAPVDDVPVHEDVAAPDLPAAPAKAEAAPAKAEDGGGDSAKKSGAPAQAGGGAKSTVRVDLDLVDRLINIVGELVINQSMLSQCVHEAGIPPRSEIGTGLDEFRNLARELQENVMVFRAQSVKPLFQRMGRIVREASDISRKKSRLVTEGEATEVDKTVIERLADPLTHMIRNAVDHGLEKPEDRIKAGKPETGVITLSAAHRSGRVIIEVSDDGGGINRERVRQKAIEKGLIPADLEMSDAEIDKLLFLPGFSTAATVSDLSGRGVGMDVVKSAIQALGGRISIRSQPGQGTSFSISLPLTLAVLEGMIVDVAGQTMVLPISSIVETLRPAADDIHRLGTGSHVVAVRGEFLPIIDLGVVFGHRQPPIDFHNCVLLLVDTEQRGRCALAVDGIHDQRQVVIKGLEENFGHVGGVAAATILGDGKIALIIDPEEAAGGGELRSTLNENRAAIQEKLMEQAAEMSKSELRELVSFRVREQDFCIDTISVREIRGWTAATILPHVPDYVMGVINLRGSVVPIMNLATRLGLQPIEPDSRHVIIIVKIGDQTMGLLVDAVSDILSIARSEIQPTPNVASDRTHAFVEGVIATEDRMLRLLNLATVLPEVEKEAV